MSYNYSAIACVAAPVFVMHNHGDRRITAWNPFMEKITGIPATDAIDQRPTQVFGQPGALLDQCSGHEPVVIEGVGAVALAVADGFVVGTVSDHERETYLGMAAHDLRAPLRNILFLADEAMHDTYAAHALLAQIKKVSRQGIALTNDVVACAQSRDTMAADFSKFSIGPICDTILATLDGGMGHNVSVSDVPVLAERPVIQIVLRNLLDNAIRHGGNRKMAIEIGVKDTERGLHIHVSDNGDGFASPARALLGGGEFRVDSGYGLIGIRRLVRSRGGSLSVQSSDNKPGSTVSVVLPGCVLQEGQVAAAS